ncbi:YAP-binding/ALF4/Glomulin [Amylocarpus encephaloides]|uniref:YAP-binding/ALF4/Glomulin n=1 Tax=Amylocarpus encephaloides TaxID=45428 RepID=A0A9P8C528_9HELO|nr:YAP-binding/ALF4/Glomulin [Amylocarpus encephaloides]
MASEATVLASEASTSASNLSPDDAITAITESLPPKTDPLTYLTILESHLSTEILPTLNHLLQDAELTQNIGWDLIHLLLPLPGGEKCLGTIARLGNPREVVLKVTEALQLLDVEAKEQVEDSDPELAAGSGEDAKEDVGEPTTIDKFCVLVNLLSILHPRIKTKYPSRFLQTSLMAILTAFRPSNQATLAVISFVHTISGKKRPPLPGRQSSASIPVVKTISQADPSAPDPEAQDEDPREAVIQNKFLQSFVTHILEDYVNNNPLEWSARLLELFQPKKVMSGRKSVGEYFREVDNLQTRDVIVGQLVALARDLGLSDYSELTSAICKVEDLSEEDPEESYPSSPDAIPLSKAGSLILITCLIFASVIFDSKSPPPKLSIFPDHAKLVKQFLGPNGPATIGGEDQGVIDAVLAIGLWLEHNNQFVLGPLEDDDFLEELQALSLLSANTPSSSLRYAAHSLTSAILHAHPVDRLRLTFITDTLEHCPYENLKASAVSWLKEEIVIAQERKSENAFGTTVALAAAQPYLFPDTSALDDANEEELTTELMQSFPFHMAVLNFIYLISGEPFVSVVPPGMLAVVEEIYLRPLKAAQVKSLEAHGGEKPEGLDHSHGVVFDLQLLGDRLELCLTRLDS